MIMYINTIPLITKELIVKTSSISLDINFLLLIALPLWLLVVDRMYHHFSSFWWLKRHERMFREDLKSSIKRGKK